MANIQKPEVAQIAPPKMAGDTLVNENESTQTKTQDQSKGDQKDQPRDPEKMERGDLVQALLDSRDEAHRANEEAAKSREIARKLNDQVNTGAKAYSELRADHDQQAEALRQAEEELKCIQKVNLLNENPEAAQAQADGIRNIAHAVATGVYASGWMPTADEGTDKDSKKIIGMKTMARHIVGMAEVIHSELAKKNL